MGRPWAHVTCSGCGKKGYYSRKTAKRELRASGLNGLCVYECKTSPTPLWHWGHLPVRVKDGRQSRSEIGYAAPRSPWRKRVAD